MEYEKLIADRYSVRQFQDKPIGKGSIDMILNAGHIAPTGCNNQPQRILVINSDEAIEKLQKCTKCHFNARTAMLICYNEDESWIRPYDGALAAPIDCSIVTTHMMLMAHSLGIGNTWVMHFDPFTMREEFNIPENIHPVALLVMGYPADDAEPNPRHTQYRPLDEVVVYNEF